MDETQAVEGFGPETARDRIDAVGSAMRGRVRRPLWALLALGVGYALPFAAAGADVIVLSCAIALGLLIVPFALDAVVRRASGVAGDVLSTPRGRSWQFAWAGVFIAALAATIVVTRVTDVAAIGVIVGVAIVPLTVLAYRGAEAAVVRAARGGRDA